MTATPTAVAAASRLEPGAAVRWRDLELAAFSQHPRVTRALDPRGRRSATRPSSMRVVRMIVVALVALCPVWTLATLLGGRFVDVQVDGATAVPAAAILTTIGLAVPAWLAWRGLSDPAQRRGSLAGIGAIYLGIGIVLGILVVARADAGQAIALALVPFAATALIGLLLVVAGAWFALRGRGAQGPHAGRGAPAPVDGPLPVVRAAVARLDEPARAAVRADLDAAIVDLERRGVIDRAASATARRADLGLLAVRMSQSPRG
ncbi:hypothetical protein GCM10009846_04630 [Agrococcus versicolor]|uniref:Uncharacterized protein n=1 Tax=Agrococcus versicolor TaxID=501482 RepID=A0ABP5ME16_9MICO